MDEVISTRPEDTETAVERGVAIPSDSKHWRSTRDAEGVLTLILDRAGGGANTLGQDVLREFESIVDTLEKNPPTGLILTSGKEDHFAYGADVKEFGGFQEPEETRRHILRVHEMLDRFEALPCPTAAMIRGACLGGGLELALACKYRVARDDAKLGFPEVMVGIHPGFGGTMRSTRLLPATAAMQMMLTGRSEAARKAQRIGLVDDVQPERHLQAAARTALAKGFPRKHGRPKVWLLNTWPARAVMAPVMRRKTAEKVREEHYPAPFALIDIWRKNGGSRNRMLDAEARSVARLLADEKVQNLIRVFGLRERLKDVAKADGANVTQVHVVGAGVMGGDIAAWCALKGLRVSLADLDVEQIGRAIGRADDLFRKKLRKSAAVRDAHDRLTPDPRGEGLPQADLVIEAVAEKLDVKKKVFADIEAKAKSEAILATNTSSIRLQDIAEALSRPSRLIGLHFFNPVAKLPLVEVVSFDKSSKKVRTAGARFADRIGKLPLPVKSAPGFLVNRSLTPYMLEAMIAMEEGIAPETIDRAAEQFGMPVGPIELADQVGLDIALEVGRQIAEESPIEAPRALVEKVEAGKLGKKSGEGFYTWKDGEAQKEDADAPPEDLTDRLILPMLNAFAACVRTGVVAEEELADAGAVFGTGFAPFRGGPLHYADVRGAAEVRDALDALKERYGDRFAPDEFWSKRVES